MLIMYVLSKYVPLIPLVGKADSMTPAEARDQLQVIKNMCAQAQDYVPGLKARSIMPRCAI